MPLMHEAGIAMARGFPEWRSIEPRRGEWKWDKADALVQAASSHQLEVNACLMGAVPWSTEKIHAFPMSDLEAWSGFVEQCVARYKDRIHYWEVWNEGNGGFNDGHHTTEDYAKLASAMYAAAKKSDPNAMIGLTSASFDPDYLEHVILAQKAAGTPASFDYLCIHPYELADNIGRPGGDVPYLWMTHLLRDSMKKSAPEKADSEVWITEVGRNIARRKDQAVAEQEAAAALVKIYVMALAQGISSVQWFEAQDPANEEPGFGLLKRDGSPRLSYRAFKTMTAELGRTPKYLGWLAMGEEGRGLGFVFQGATAPVLIAWKDAGDADQSLLLDGEVLIKGVDGALNKRPAMLADEPVFIGNISAAMVAQAAANKAKNFPWGGDFTGATTVSAKLGGDERNQAVTLAGKQTLPKITFPDGTTGFLIGANQSTQFCVHPSFASIHNREYDVRITVRRISPGNVGMNLVYERTDTQGRAPYRNQGTWFGLSKEDGWQTFTWHVKDACFAKMWGYDFSFVPEQSQPFVIGKIEVSTGKL